MSKPRFLDNNDFICEMCATYREWTIPEGHMATWHYGECDNCGEKKGVTQVRDYRK